jgi:hypothetical protein
MSTPNEAARLQREIARLLSGRSGPIRLVDRASVELIACLVVGARAPEYLSETPSQPGNQGSNASS